MPQLEVALFLNFASSQPRVASPRLQPRGKSQGAAFEEDLKCPGEDLTPALEVGQLLRTSDQATQELGDGAKRIGGRYRAGVRAGDLDRRLSRVTHALGDGVQQQGSAGDGFSVPIRLGQTNENVPPIIEQRVETRRQTTARQIMSDEAAPSPLVLQLVKYVLTVRPIAIELAEAPQLFDETGHENLIFPNLLAWADIEESQPRLPFLVRRGRGQRTLHAPPQHDDAALSAPTNQPNDCL